MSRVAQFDDKLGRLARGEARLRARAPRSTGRRTTVRVPEGLDEILRALADRLGTTRNDVLVLLAEAAAEEITRRRELAERMRQVVADFEREHGEIPPEALAEVDRLWPA